MYRRFLSIAVCLFAVLQVQAGNFKQFLSGFESGYTALHIPELVFDYHDYFNSIPQLDDLDKQEAFFRKEQRELRSYTKGNLDSADQLYYTHLAYEIDLNLQRVLLEQQWVKQGKKMPQNGLYALANHKQYYALFVKRYTSSAFTPEQVFELGISETKRVQQQIESIQNRLGFTDKAAFYKHLQNDSFYLSDKESIALAYAEIDKRVREHLNAFVDMSNVPPVSVMEWPNAGPNTPPGIYLSKDDNPYGKDVFQYNFYGGRHNKRAMDWLYMHEAIPGHHLQSTLRKSLSREPGFQHLFYYPGNFEGWGCYVEYYGKDIGLYTDPYKELGKWEWDLVRSVRLVLDAGIHYYGWDHDKAAKFWKENVPGQDDIMEREITRVTNWPAQALSYKVGAHEIEAMKQDAMLHGQNFDLKEFHKRYLLMSYYPLEIVKQKLHSDYFNNR